MSITVAAMQVEDWDAGCDDVGMQEQGGNWRHAPIFQTGDDLLN